MPRATATIRRATADDVPVLLDLVAEMRALVSARLPTRTAPDVAEASRIRLTSAIESPDHCVLLAVSEEDEPVGMALLELADASSLFDIPVVLVAFAHVRKPYRRRGTGRAFLAEAAAWAEAKGLDAVAVNVAAQQRDAQRFYVRMGFSPVSVRRVAPLPLLKRRLGLEALAPPVPTVGEAVHTATRRAPRARAMTARAVSARRRAQ